LRSIFEEIVAMNKFSDYNIPFTGLSLGKHYYEFKIGKAFFNLFEYCEIDDGEFDVKVELDKKSTMLILNFEMAGNVTSNCDRCGSKVNIPVEYSDRIYVKFGGEPSDDENIMILAHNAHQINVAQLIEEFAVLALPARKVHEKGKCNKKALKLLDEFKHHSSEEIDPRWEKLKGLLKSEKPNGNN
jgi:uncharacterized metal-binding protein YceD (DUF177 family)